MAPKYAYVHFLRQMLVIPGPGLASRALAPRSVRSLVGVCAVVGSLHILPLPACSPGRGLQTAPGAVGFTHTLGVTARGFDESAWALLAAAGPAVIVFALTGPSTSPVTFRGHGAGLSSPPTGLSHERGVGVLGGVARIVWRFLVPPRIAATLGRECDLLLRLQTAPSCGLSLFCGTSPGCSSVCRGPTSSGMRLQALCFWLLPSSQLGCCLDLLPWSR